MKKTFEFEFCGKHVSGTVTRKNGDVVNAKIEGDLEAMYDGNEWKPETPPPELQEKICQATV